MKRNISIICLLVVLMIALSSCSTKLDNNLKGDEKNVEASATNNGEKPLEGTASNGDKPAEGNATSQTKELKIKEGLVLVSDIDPTIVIDLRYATANNFTGKKIYPKSICLLRKETAEKIAAVNAELKEKGYRIKIWDGYRPHYVQQILYDGASDKSFVADPKKGSNHNRGAAIDLTMVDNKGKEVLMPSPFDEFTARASRNNSSMSKEAKKNLDLLTSIMIKHGFKTIKNEWWHFDDVDSSKYKVLNLKLEQF